MVDIPGRMLWRIGRVLSALMVTVFLFCLAVWLVLHAGWLYDLDLVRLGLDERTGMTIAEIRANYQAVIRYNDLWQRGPLVLPTLPMSVTGEIHFQEVKRIFDFMQIAGVVTMAASVILIVRGIRRNDLGWLRLSGVLGFVIPLVLGTLAALNWERFFVSFHELFFDNDYWLFDPVTDPVINILPDTYFLHCAVGILILVAAGSVICLLAGRKRTTRRSSYRR